MGFGAAAAASSLTSAGLDQSMLAEWIAAEPRGTTDYAGDRHRYCEFWNRCDGLLRRLPAKPARNSAEIAAAQRIFSIARGHREAFLTAHVATIYDELTLARSRFVRLPDLVLAAAAAVPGLTPSAPQIAAEASRPLRDKEGFEIDQGIFFSHVLANETAGRHLCHAMLLPRPQSAELLAKLGAGERIDLDHASVERRGQAVLVTTSNQRFLNAEDQTTIDATEIAVDLATLDPATEVAVLRGGKVDHPKYGGRRAFGSGINLTHLYQGRIPFLWYLVRDLGFVHKLLRGVARAEALPDDVHGHGIEKPWIAAVDGFAIGGHCQILLTMDYVLAASDAFMTLPARKEGIIPGLANLRLPRFTGDRIARQAILHDRKLICDSPEGRLICDQIVAPADMDRAIDAAVAGLTGSGVVSATANRRAFRIGQEPLDLFRAYCSAYARDQAYSHFSPALIANLEREWNAQNRSA
jgi:(3,5-dihydroxyphenyl)acetyl-CoA 1,2-dioxygenase